MQAGGINFEHLTTDKYIPIDSLTNHPKIMLF